MKDTIEDILTVAESPFGGQAFGLPCGAWCYTGVGAEPRLALPAPWFVSGLILFTIIGWVFS